MRQIFYTAMALMLLSGPSQAATVSFETTGTVTAAFTLPGASWTGVHPIEGETYTRLLTLDDAAEPISYSHIDTDVFNAKTANYATSEIWVFDSSNITHSIAGSLTINANQITGAVSVSYATRETSYFVDRFETRDFQSDVTASELIYLLADGPVFTGGAVLNLGSPDHWIGGCETTAFRAWCGIEFDVTSSGLADPSYIPAIPQSFADQRPLLAPVPLPASLPLFLSVLAMLPLVHRRARV